MIYNTLNIYATATGAKQAGNRNKSLFSSIHIAKGNELRLMSFYNVEIHCPLHQEDMNWFIKEVIPRMVSRK